MELNASINTFYKGLDLDSDISVLDKNAIRYAENIRLTANSEGTSAVAQNSDYIQKYNINLPSEVSKIIGVVESKYCHCENGVCGTPRDCAVVFTQNIEDDVVKNGVYCVDFNDDAEHTVRTIITGDFGWNERLSLVSNFESCEVSNVYVADGVHNLRVVNIAKEYGDVVNSSVLDSVPNAQLNPFTYEGPTSGRLPVGKVQYAYQLFNEHGTSSAVSPLSEMISISAKNNSISGNFETGSQPNTISNSGAIVKTSIINNGFNKIRIYRIIYEIAGQLPEIHIANEINISAENTYIDFKYTDNGVSTLKVMTAEEFNLLARPYLFIPQTIESKDNRLFAANVTEDTWDVEYDARAYRADIDGNVLITDTYRDSITFSIDDDTAFDSIPEDYDCNNPSNAVLFAKDSYKYIYKDSNGTIGGKGKNVEYEFTLTGVAVSSQESTIDNAVDNIVLNTGGLGNEVEIRSYSDGSVQRWITLPTNGRASYTNPYFSSHYVGYQRDEIYRFGVVFYNEKGIATPVHWIGDIRMPISLTDDIPERNAFQVGALLKTQHTSQYSTIELKGNILGLRFTVNSIPEGVVSYEIVRCKRTSENRTVITQGILGGLINFPNNWGGEDLSIGEKDLRPIPIFSLDGEFNAFLSKDAWMNFNSSMLQDYFELVSPEICVDRNSILAESKKNAKICPLYYTWCDAKKEETLTIRGISRTLHHLSSYPSKIYSATADELSPNDTYALSYSDYDDWLFMGFTEDIYNDADEGASHVLKYYYKENIPVKNSYPFYGDYATYTVSDAIASSMEIPYQIDVTDLKNYQQPIGNMSYIGASMSASHQYGIHGRNLVVKLDADFKEGFELLDRGKGWYNTTRIVNLKKLSNLSYSTYVDRLSSSYISCGCHSTKENIVTYCYGGDTYLGVLDYLNTSYIQRKTDPTKERSYRLHVQCYIPFETTVNVNLLSNDQYHQLVERIDGEYVSQNLIQDQPASTATYVQNHAQYTYNTIYSADGNVYSFVSKSMYSKDDVSQPNRILSSELKINNELLDSWVQFKVANYLDVDNAYGKITNLKTFGDKLYFFQDNAVGIASVNERSLINDNHAALVLGTGGILVRFDYLDNTNGNSIINDYSIVNSASTLYWYDYNNNEICAINNDVIELSKAKSVKSYYNNLYKNKVDRSRPVGIFNKKYNEIWMNVANKSIVFNEQLNAFTSFYTHQPDFALMFGNKIVTIVGNSFYEHNETIDSTKSVEPLISKLQIVSNDDFVYTKVFDNVLFYADFEGNVNNISELYFTTKNQTSNIINNTNIECREDVYRLPIPREVIDDENTMSYLGRMRGHYLNHFYTFDCNDEKTFKIPYIKTTYRQSKL